MVAKALLFRGLLALQLVWSVGATQVANSPGDSTEGFNMDVTFTHIETTSDSEFFDFVDQGAVHVDTMGGVYAGRPKPTRKRQEKPVPLPFPAATRQLRLTKSERKRNKKRGRRKKLRADRLEAILIAIGARSDFNSVDEEDELVVEDASDEVIIVDEVSPCSRLRRLRKGRRRPSKATKSTKAPSSASSSSKSKSTKAPSASSKSKSKAKSSVDCSDD